MLWRLLGHFSYDKQAGIALTTALSILSLILLIYTGLDLARYHMINRGLSSAAQQTVEWMANRGASATEDPNVLTRDAIVGRMGKNIIPSTALYSGITSVTTTFSYDGPTGVSRLIVKANYNLMLRKTFNLQPLAMSADARIKLNPVFLSIVFSSGEMRSEGNSIYGQGQSGALAPNRGVSWSNPYYTSVINQSVATRTTPTHNYYMTTALVKELAGKFQFRKHYMNIIPVSATINLNPRGYSSNPPGSKEGKLPLWIYNDTGFQIDNTSMANNTSEYCITNRSFPSNLMTVYSVLQNIYHVPLSNFSSQITGFANNSFNSDSTLMDSSVPYGYPMPGNFASTAKRGYPFSPLSGGKCPANNTTPALASFHELTTVDYTADSTNTATVTENQNFWDYMRNYIDPAKVPTSKIGSYAIWGSPNITFGLQIAYENIADVQNFKRINNSTTGLDPTSEFFVYVVSDQIGGVKNAAGAPYYIPQYDTIGTLLTSNYPTYNQCKFVNQSTWGPCLNETQRSPYMGKLLPSNDSNYTTTTNFQFTHFWWDSIYNPVKPACYANGLNNLLSCDVIYSAHPQKIVQNFYNIINYSIDLKFNKNLTNTFKKPLVFFIDTGSGKSSDECQASNNYETQFSFINPATYTFPNTQYTSTKPCMAYAEMSGYNTNNSTFTDSITSRGATNSVNEGAIINIGSNSADTSDQWIPSIDVSGSKNIIHASGFSKVFAYKFTNSGSGPNRNLDTLAPKYLPIDYYNSNYKLQLKSHPNSSATYDTTVNNTANAALIAKYVVQQSLRAQPILRPY